MTLRERSIERYESLTFGMRYIECMSKKLLELMDLKPDHVELVITGRGATDKVMARADLVTEMREIKHYYKKGVKARVGIEK